MKTLYATKKIMKFIFIAIVFCFYVQTSYAQNAFHSRITYIPDIHRSNITLKVLAKNSITAIQTQEINFGTYCVTGTSGGTITVGWDGNRTSTGDIVLMSMSPIAQSAIFEIKTCQGNNVSITYASTTTINGSNGGSLVLDIGPTEKGINGSIFSIKSDCNRNTQLRVGGTLHIPSTATPGNYSGRFDITFKQE